MKKFDELNGIAYKYLNEDPSDKSCWFLLELNETYKLNKGLFFGENTEVSKNCIS